MAMAFPKPWCLAFALAQLLLIVATYSVEQLRSNRNDPGLHRLPGPRWAVSALSDVREHQQQQHLRTLLQGDQQEPPSQPQGAPQRFQAQPPGRRPCDEACYRWATCNEELGRCDCPKHRTGPSCEGNASAIQMRYYLQSPAMEMLEPMSCLNGCNGRGTCHLGACVCERGYFSSDCSLSIGPDGKPVLLDGKGYLPRERRPYIYVYDIPHKYSSWNNPKRMDREGYWSMLQRMLAARVLVADGDEADWYFIPIKMRNSADGPKLLKVLDYVRQHWPWYGRLQGQRHFVLHTGDSGRGEVPPIVRQETLNLTWLHHWGLTEDYPFSGWHKCHRPGKDVVVPVALRPKLSHDLVSMTPLHPRAPALPRNGTLLFAGRVCGDGRPPDPAKPWPHCQTPKSKGYSQGARQLVHFHHHNRTGFRVVTTTTTYLLDLMRFKWCLAPSGGGHGHRQALAAVMGCLPVVVSDFVMQPFEPEMDWNLFGMRVAQDDVPTMHKKLAAVSKRQYDKMQAAVRCAAQHLMYSSIKGAMMQEDGRWDAFETILEVLRMQQLHPGLHPSLYVKTDERFRAFMHCGSTDMVSYGKLLREERARKYPVPLGAQVYGHNLTWDIMYDGRALGVLLQKAAEPLPADEAGGEAQLPLCSTSMWDPVSLRCNCKGYQSCFMPGAQVFLEG